MFQLHKGILFNANGLKSGKRGRFGLITSLIRFLDASLCKYFAFILLIGCNLLYASTIYHQIHQIEKEHDGRIGISVINTANNQSINYRAHERFPMGCTSKVIGVAAMLDQSITNPSLLNKKITYSKADLVAWSPITSRYVNDGMTVKALGEAAIRYSDNTAMNLLVQELGGLSVLNAYAKALGDKAFRQDNTWPEEANSGGKDVSDSSTPANMVANLNQLLLKNNLDAPQRKLLRAWMLGCTTGKNRIRAGIPKHWKVAHKTGSGSLYGTTNDIAVIFPDKCSPIIVGVYYTNNKKEAKTNDKVVAEVTQKAIYSLAEHDKCLKHAIGIASKGQKQQIVNMSFKRCII